MTMSRRQMVQRSAAGAAGLVVAGTTLSTMAQSTPVPNATPRAMSGAHLGGATELAIHREDVQCVAIMPADAFNARRIPGSIHLDWAELALNDTSEDAVAEWTSSMQEFIAVRGIRADEPVVVYDEGSLFAARGWWQLAYLGYAPPVVLDGGLPAWEEIGEPVESGPVEINPVEVPQPENPAVRREILATKEEVLAALDDPDVLLVDARSSGEFSSGHIPGAVNMLYTSNAIMKEANLYLPADELRSRYEELGMTPEKRAITYCSTGARGSVATFAMTLAGFGNVALYVGSWDEWSADPEMPVE